MLADGGRQLAQDPLDLLALRARRLRLAVAELDDLERLDEERLARVGGVVDDARHAAARARLDGEHRPAAALGDEVLLQVLADAALAHELLEPVGDALPPVRSSPRSLRSCGDALSFRSEPSCSTARSIASASGVSAGSIAAASSRSSGALLLLERAARAQRAGDRVADVPQRCGAERRRRAPRSAAVLADVAIPSSGGSAAMSSSAIASAVSAWRRATSSASADGSSAPASVGAVLGRSGRGDPLAGSPGTPARRARRDPRAECRGGTET